MIHLGVEAISWHARVASNEISVRGILDEAASAGAEFVQVGVDYVTAEQGGAAAVVQHAADNGVFLRATGRPIGRRYWAGDSQRVIAEVEGWLRVAAEIGSDSLMLYSGVYRPELAGNPGAAAAELDHLSVVLGGAEATAADLGVSLLLENASDFTSAELLGLLERCGSQHVGQFLDLTNVYNVWDDPFLAIERLAPHAKAGHVKDFVLESIWAESGYHRNGYSVSFRYPGEGVTPVADLVSALLAQVDGRDFCLAVEGLDSRAGVPDQVDRLRSSFGLLREVAQQPTTARPSQEGTSG